MGAKIKTINDLPQTKTEIILKLCAPPLTSQKFNSMEQAKKKSSALYWLLFFISVAAFVLMYYSPLANYITATLPFVCYYLVKAMDLI